MRYLTIIGVLLCVILVATKTANLAVILNRSEREIIFQMIFDLSFYLIPLFVMGHFKDKALFYVLLFCWLSCDVSSYSGLLYGYTKNAYYALFYTISLSYLVIFHRKNINTIYSFAIMISFQIMMVVDWFNGDDQTFVYQNYHYLLTGIHLLIISTMVRWTIIARCRAYINHFSRGFLCRTV